VSGTARLRRNKRKSKGKRQKSKGKNLWAGPEAGLGTDLRGPQSNQSSMTQFLSGTGNWPPRGIFVARKEMGL
jgi:hypothetical protein